jgi:hypothetical protein
VSKIPGYQQLTNISEMLQNKTNLHTRNEHSSIFDIINFVFVSMASCYVERVFSQYKNILADNRWKFTFENLLHHVVKARATLQTK